VQRYLPAEQINNPIIHAYTPVVFICVQIVVRGQCNAYRGYFARVRCRTFCSRKIKTTHIWINKKSDLLMRNGRAAACSPMQWSYCILFLAHSLYCL